MPLIVNLNNSACLNEEERPAWACSKGPSVNLEIISSGTDMPQINIISGQTDEHVHYGAQSPQLSQPANLTIMNDINERDRGPAYYFQQLYNKTVILKSEDFFASSQKRWSARDIEAAESRAIRGKGSAASSDIAQPSDRPWYCFWNDTMLEGFIYATEDNGNAIQTSAPLSWKSTPVSTSGFGASTTSTSLSQTSSLYNPSSEVSVQRLKRQATGLPCPKKVKLEERRTQRSPAPYCQQMQFVNGDPVPVDPSVSRTLDEDEPAQQHRLDRGGNSGQWKRTNGDFRKSVRDMTPTTGACQCMWRNTQ